MLKEKNLLLGHQPGGPAAALLIQLEQICQSHYLRKHHTCWSAAEIETETKNALHRINRLPNIKKKHFRFLLWEYMKSYTAKILKVNRLNNQATVDHQIAGVALRSYHHGGDCHHKDQHLLCMMELYKKRIESKGTRGGWRRRFQAKWLQFSPNIRWVQRPV